MGKADTEEVGVYLGGAKYFIALSIAHCDWVVYAVNAGDKPMGHWLLVVPAWWSLAKKIKNSVGPFSASAHRENARYARLPVQPWVCLRLATIKGHSKMCSFTVLGGGVWWGPKTSQYLVWPPFASRSATHLLRIELIRLLIVACGMLVHSSSMAVCSCWILAGTGTRCRVRRSRASQTCSMGEYAGHARTGCFQLPGIVYRSLQHGAVHYHAATWGDGVDAWHNNGPQDLVTVSLCIQNAINKCNLCSLSITYACPYHNPHRHHGPLDPKCWHQQTAYLHDAIHAVCLSGPVQWKLGFIREENTSPKCQTPSNVSILPTQVGYDDEACRLASLRRFLTVCAEILWLCKPIVAAAVRVAGLRQSWRWRCWMWRSWAGVVTRGLRLWGRLDVLPNSLKRLWKWFMVEKWTFNSQATALVDIPAVSMPIATLPQNLQHLWHCAVW